MANFLYSRLYIQIWSRGNCFFSTAHSVFAFVSEFQFEFDFGPVLGDRSLSAHSVGNVFFPLSLAGGEDAIRQTVNQVFPFSPNYENLPATATATEAAVQGHVGNVFGRSGREADQAERQTPNA